MAALTWGIAIPFREDPNPNIDRGLLLDTVLDYLAQISPDAPVQAIDSDPSRAFNRAGARNACVRHAEAEGWDVVVILDADTLPPRKGLLEAVEAAIKGGLHQPFHRCVTLNPDMDITPLTLTAHHISPKTAQRVWVSPGSCYVLRPDVYWEVGGQDEGFIHWGGEDSAFVAAARAFGHSVQRHPLTASRKPDPSTTAVQLHHGTADDRRKHPTYPDTIRRQTIYERLVRDPATMREWISERHQPAAETKWAIASRHTSALRTR